jgi:methionine sulfoxide reductase heme-binding subunit
MQWLIFLAGLTPLGLYVWWFFNNRLDPNPVEAILHASGDWGIYCLLASLAVTPLRRFFKRPMWIIWRRPLGLLAFFYAVLHMSLWLWLEEGLDLATIRADLTTKRFVIAGMFSVLVMLPLALTSFNRAIGWLGGRNWNRLHKTVYLAAIAAVVHYIWLVKSSLVRPLLFAAILAILLATRLIPNPQRVK